MTQVNELVFYDRTRFGDFLETNLQINDVSKKKTLKVDVFGRIYFLSKSDKRYNLDTKDRTEFLRRNEGVFDYHYDVLK